MVSVIITVVIIAGKFGIPVLFFLFPFQASWFNYFLDVVDGDALQFLGFSERTYQIVDKWADFVTYICMFLVGLRWRIRKTTTVLFLYRSIGQILFFLTLNEIYFFYFQNLLEPIFMIYALILFQIKNETKAYQYYKKHRTGLWIGILVYKLWNEWYLHYANIDLSLMFFGINGGSQ